MSTGPVSKKTARQIAEIASMIAAAFVMNVGKRLDIGGVSDKSATNNTPTTVPADSDSDSDEIPWWYDALHEAVKMYPIPGAEIPPY